MEPRGCNPRQSAANRQAPEEGSAKSPLTPEPRSDRVIGRRSLKEAARTSFAPWRLCVLPEALCRD